MECVEEFGFFLLLTCCLLVPHLFGKGSMNIRWNEATLAVRELKDLFDQIRASEKELLVRHEKDCLDRIVKMAIHLRHLKFMLKV